MTPPRAGSAASEGRPWQLGTRVKAASLASALLLHLLFT